MQEELAHTTPRPPRNKKCIFWPHVLRLGSCYVNSRLSRGDMDSPHFTGHITVTAVAALLAQIAHQLELFIVLWNTCGRDVPKSSESMHYPQTNKNHKQIFKQHFKESPFRSREKSIAQHFALWPSDDEISSSPVSLHYLVAFLPPACWALWTRYTYSSEHPGVRLSTKNGTNKKALIKFR